MSDVAESQAAKAETRLISTRSDQRLKEGAILRLKLAFWIRDAFHIQHVTGQYKCSPADCGDQVR